MVGCLDTAVQAQNPQNPLFPLVAYEKSSSSVRIRNVPKKIGKWTITSVVLAAQYPDNTTKVANCVFVGTVWVGTIAGSEDVGEGVYTIYASGIDENGQPVNDYCLGSGQVTILAQEVRRDENALVHMLYSEPTSEIREGDLFQNEQTGNFMIFKDGQAVPLTQLSDYYTKSETSSATEISNAFDNIDLSDYYTKSETSSAFEIQNAFDNIDLSDYYTKSETSSAFEIQNAFDNIGLSDYATKDDISSLSDAVLHETDQYNQKTAVTVGNRSSTLSTVGANSLAAGGSNAAAGNYSAAFGMSTSAVGMASLAAGLRSYANGPASFALGSTISTMNGAEVAVGQANASHAYDSAEDNVSSATRFAVGVGSSPERANGLEVMMDGTTYIKGMGGYDGKELSSGMPLQTMFGTQFALSGEYEDGETFEISVYGYVPPPPPPPKWFTMTNIGDSDQTFIMNNVGQFLEYSTDGGETWSQYSGSTQVTVPSGGSVKMRHLSSSGDFSPRNLNVQGSTGQWNASGNIMTLLDETGERTVLSDGYEFQYMFGDGSSSIVNIVDASELELPATTLADYCYDSMFYGCTSLTAAPALPATTLAYSCYNHMFRDCTSLTQAPELPATTLEEWCYSEMFRGCTSLTEAPELPATTLASSCYHIMFYQSGITSLTVHFTEWSPSNATTMWMSSLLSDVGTFYCPAALGTNETIQRGVDYCRDGWTVVNI